MRLTPNQSAMLQIAPPDWAPIYGPINTGWSLQRRGLIEIEHRPYGPDFNRRLVAMWKVTEAGREAVSLMKDERP